MVDCGEFGSGGKGVVLLASDVDLAATTTATGLCQHWLLSLSFLVVFPLQEVDGYLAIRREPE
jgi:hypothetical protein